MSIPTQPRSDQVPGSTFGVGDRVGDYLLEEILGAGGMGRVFAARHTSTDRRVAIKTILPQHVENEDLRHRLLREAKAAQQLRSEHAVRVFEVGSSPQSGPYIVMELLEGVSLDVIARRGPVPPADAIDYVIQACDALSEAHVLGIVHRDLKPANMFLVQRTGEPPILKILDFGISKTSTLEQSDSGGSLTATGTTLGSPTYMSPEQLRNSKRVDARADIWSLGMILHRLIAGQPAFTAESVGEHLVMIVSESPTPLRQHRSDVPIELERVVLLCLQRAPDKRYQTVGQLVTALAPFASPAARPLIRRIGQTLPDALRRSLSDTTTLHVLEDARALAREAESARSAATRAIGKPPDGGTQRMASAPLQGSVNMQSGPVIRDMESGQGTLDMESGRPTLDMESGRPTLDMASPGTAEDIVAPARGEGATITAVTDKTLDAGSTTARRAAPARGRSLLTGVLVAVVTAAVLLLVWTSRRGTSPDSPADLRSAVTSLPAAASSGGQDIPPAATPAVAASGYGETTTASTSDTAATPARSGATTRPAPRASQSSAAPPAQTTPGPTQTSAVPTSSSTMKLKGPVETSL